MPTPISSPIPNQSKMVSGRNTSNKVLNEHSAKLLGRGIRNMMSEPPPDKLAVYKPSTKQFMVTDIQAGAKQRLDNIDLSTNPQLQQQDVATGKKILTAIGIDPENMSDAQIIRAAQLASKNEVSTDWLVNNINRLNANAEVADVGKMMFSTAQKAFDNGKSGIQDQGKSWNTRIALDVAKMVIGDDGTVSQTKAQELKHQLQDDRNTHLHPNGAQRKLMIKVLDKIATDGTFRAALGNVSAPPNQATHGGRVMVQRTLGMGPTQQPSVADTRRAVLSTMLSDLRQGLVGSCFGTSVCIQMLQNQPDKMLPLVKEMVEDGRLTLNSYPNKYSPGVEVQMPVNQSQHGSSYTTTIDVKRDGSVKMGQGTFKDLKEIEGFKRALASVGLENDDTALTNALKALTLEEGSTQVWPKDIIDHMINGQNWDEGKKAGMKEIAANAFHSAEENSLLRSFEYTLASFAEANLGGTHGSDLYNTIYPVSTEFKGWMDTKKDITATKLQSKDPKFDKEEQAYLGKKHREIAMGFADKVQENYKVVYDPTMKLPTVSGDGSSEYGGFRIFLKQGDGKYTPMKEKADLDEFIGRMADEYRFEQLDKLDNDTMGVQPQLISQGAREQATKFINTFVSEVKNGKSGSGADFATMMLGDSAIKKKPEMGYVGGSDPNPILKSVYDQKEMSVVELKRGAKERTHGDARDMLKFTVQTLRDMHTEMNKPQSGYTQKDLTKMSLIVNNDVHAFRLDPGFDSQLKTAIQGKGDIDKWMETALNSKALDKWADTNIPTKEVKSFLRQYQHLGIKPDEVMKTLGQKTKPNEVLEALYNGLDVKFQDPDYKAAFSKEIINHFEAPIKSVILFDSNWGDSETQTMMGVVHNPMTGKAEMWKFDQVQDELKTVGPMNDKDWSLSRLRIFNDTKQQGFD